MESLSNLFTWCTPCCNNFDDYSQMAMSYIDKALGNIKNSSKQMSFIGLISIKNGRAKLVHYGASEHLYNDVHVPESDEGVDLGES